MTRLIDADEFKGQHDWLLHCDFPYLTEATLEELIDDAPTVDAIPISWIKDWYYRYRFCVVDVEDLLEGWEAERKKE